MKTPEELIPYIRAFHYAPERSPERESAQSAMQLAAKRLGIDDDHIERAVQSEGVQMDAEESADLPPTVELELVVVASTAHLTKHEAEKLDEAANGGTISEDNYICTEPPARVLAGAYDWFLILETPDAIDPDDANGKLCRDEWVGMMALVEWCHARGIDCVRLDRDADPIEGLEVHEW